MIALAAAIVFGTLPNAEETLRAALGIPTPTATPPLPIGAGTFLLDNTVPWGVLLSDGRPVTNLTLPQANPRPTVSAPTFVLDRGRHTIEYRAALFNTFRCVVSVPAAPDDMCPLAQSPYDLVPGLGVARLLDLQARPERLPLDQLTALRQTIETALNAGAPAATLAPGERYLLPDGSIRTASAPLRAELVYRVNRDPSVRLPANTGPCVGLCATYGTVFLNGQPPLPEGSWAIAVNLALTWRYTTADGSLVLDDAPGAPKVRDAHALYVLSVRWEGRWVVSDLANARGMVCDAPMQAPGVSAAAQTGVPDMAGYYWHPYQAHPASEGCLAAGAQEAVGGDYEPVGPTALVLYRFGLLLAANALAHQLFPSLPQATAAERALARSLAPPSAEG